ncbi:hypothetical protein C3920_00585 [Novacetimonas pomaceti]|uniref:Uncharacterized protein n=1 Tax=Novacetimonas pomaceti TaxID=2021998 RepID=A0ABX5P679_9PROT|nr:hypothetical protein C3920_00585 [Novacetimonas pomaceti]
MVKLFAKSFERRRLFEKRRHPKTFIHISRLFPNPTHGAGRPACICWRTRASSRSKCDQSRA